MIFKKGTGIIEKTYKKEELKKTFQINEFTDEVRQSKKSLKAFGKRAEGSGRVNLMVSGAAGVGMGLLGVGIPDIPVFTGIDAYIADPDIPQDYEEKIQIEKTAGELSKELLYMKFLQGISIVGAVGGIYDVVYMKRITEYANLKYKKRFLMKIPTLKVVLPSFAFLDIMQARLNAHFQKKQEMQRHVLFL